MISVRLLGVLLGVGAFAKTSTSVPHYCPSGSPEDPESLLKWYRGKTTKQGTLRRLGWGTLGSMLGAVAHLCGKELTIHEQNNREVVDALDVSHGGGCR